MSMTVRKSSVFPANIEAVWKRLQSLKYLQYVAYPYATFKPAGGEQRLIWREGRVFPLEFRLFGMIPFGVHSIRIVTLDKEKHVIYSNESNLQVPVWNHRITLEMIDDVHTRYTDEVEIDAGWKTPFIYLWAEQFYSHRQRKWIQLLGKQKGNQH